MTQQPGHLWRVIQSWLDSTWNPPSQNKLAGRLGVSGSALGDYKYARHMPSPEFLQALAEVIQVPYELVLDATLKDNGYRRPDQGELMGNAEHPAATKTPETGPANQPVLRDVSDLEADYAAREDPPNMRTPKP